MSRRQPSARPKLFDRLSIIVMVVVVTSSCADWIAPIKVGEPCTQRSDCKGFAFCYEGHCVAAPQCNLDGILNPGEECDDGNTDTQDACTNYCLRARCGDRIVRTDLDSGDENYEACEPDIGDLHLACGDDCQLRPEPRRLLTMQDISCILDTPKTARCWGVFVNYTGLATSPRTATDEIDVWLGTRLEFASPMAGFSMAIGGLWAAGPQGRGSILFDRSSRGRYWQSKMYMTTASQIILEGIPQGGTGEPHNRQWQSAPTQYQPVNLRDLFPTDNGWCFVSQRGDLSCFESIAERKGSCRHLYRRNLEPAEFSAWSNMLIPRAQYIVGVARTGDTVCAFDEFGDVGCLGDLTAFRPLRHTPLDTGYVCNNERRCTDPNYSVCSDPDLPAYNQDRTAYQVAPCLQCARDSDCNQNGIQGLCFDFHCYHGADAQALRNCESKPFTRIDGLEEVVEIVADESSFAVRTRNGDVYHWGRRVINQFGNEIIRRVQPIQQVDLPAEAMQLAANANTMCALLIDGRVYCWGQYNGGTGVAPERIRSLPFVIELGQSSRRSDHFCAVVEQTTETESDIYCWGKNDWHQLGDGTRDERLDAVPVSVGFDRRPGPLPR